MVGEQKRAGNSPDQRACLLHPLPPGWGSAAFVPAEKPCNPGKPGTDLWGNSEPVDSTAPACSGSIAPSARLPAGTRAAARPACSSRSLPLLHSALARVRCRTARCAEQDRPDIQHLSWVKGPIGFAKPLSSFPRFSGSQVRVICIPAMFPISTTMQSRIDAWEEAQASGEWVEPAPEPTCPAAWWLIQLEEEPPELELPLRWSV